MATTTQQSIQGFYQNILRRIGSAADVTFWANVVDVQGVPLSQVENTFVTSPEAMTFVLPIVEIYQTYLGRAPDSAGFNAWVNALHSGTSLSTVESDFANSAESQAYYGGSISAPADSAFVTKLYQTVLNRAPTPAEVTAILAVTTNRATLLQDFLQSPEAGVTLTNASNQFLTAIGSGNTDPYGASLFSGGSTVSNVFTLTPGADTIPGGLVGSNGTTDNGNVLIQGVVDKATPANTTLNASDNLDGGTGANTISVTYTGGAVADATNGALIKDVQTFNIRNTTAGGGNAVTLNGSLIAGLTAVNNNLGVGNVVVTAATLPTGASVGVIGNGTVDNGNTTASYVAAATAATINLSGGTTDGNVSVTGAGITSTTINSTGAANKINNLTISGKSLTISASTNLTDATVTDAALTSITASGAATSVNLGSLAAAPAVKTIDASGLTGGGISVSAVSSALTAFTGGVGNDTLLFAAGGFAASGQTLNGGTGTNIIGSSDVGVLGNPGPSANFYTGVNASTNFQTLELTGAGGVTLDQSKVTNPAFTTAEFNNAGIDPLVNNAVAGVDYSIVAAAAVDLSAAVGQTMLNASLDGSSKAAATAVSLDETGAQTFDLASNGSFTAANTLTGADSFFVPDNTTLNITGSQALTTGAIFRTGAGVIGETVNAGAFTGKLTVNNSTGNIKTNFTTGANGSALTAATAAINNFTLGTGADKLSFLGTSSEINAGAGVDTATAFDATKDSFHLRDYVPTAVDLATGTGTALGLLVDLNTAIGAAGIAPGHASLVTLNGGTDAGTYLAAAASAAGGPLVGTDQAIKMVGLTGTLGGSNFA
jgi:hypothetical protein